MRHTATAFALGLLLAACAGTETGESPPQATAAASESPASTPRESATPASPTTAPSASPDEALGPDTLATVTGEGLAVRADASTGSERIAVLSASERIYLVEGPVAADGFEWFRVAPAGDRWPDLDCSQPTETSIHCANELGWAAAVTPDGERYMQTFDPGCPAELDTEAYLAFQATQRLACAGDAQWRLVAYMAPETEGRGCFPVWLTDPFWLDGSCSFLFPQPIESRFDSDTRIQAFVPPELGQCSFDGCPFDELKGSWVEIVAHLDDPAAESCTTVLSESIGEAPYPPPGPQLTIFNCRTRLVIDEVQETAPPES